MTLAQPDLLPNRRNGSSQKLMEWAEKRKIAIQYIQPGQPQQNAYIEGDNRTVRHEWLDQ